ncbi:cellulose binding domain-containing protein [Paractinoplanes toevensis]|uniref:CBM2 domain-containing protein n=1 Tax=Paractinoplanes toevensis TaxID=571911 RepID=A0A919TA84_9ACTN|nr:cellulose binding domain-containing protein [Actinoplanes toevensis]GIM91347.1 hypothetical protein Ato02nite_031400 [Actinoplanes toevensis]
MSVLILRSVPGRSEPSSLPPPEPAFTLPGVTSGPQIPVSLLPSTPTDSPARSADVEKASKTVPPGDPTADPQPTTAPPGVTGTYRVLNSYPDSFIGEVLIRNDTGAGRSWTVSLRYPGTLVTSWLESLPQPTLVQRGTSYTWTSSVPLAAGSTGSLRFHFQLSGSAGPEGCTVNGSACG